MILDPMALIAADLAAREAARNGLPPREVARAAIVAYLTDLDDRAHGYPRSAS
jgi:hypothetical protein